MPRHHRRSTAGSRSSRAAALGLVALAIVAPQLLGGATPETELVILVLACVVCVGTALALHTRAHDHLGLAPIASVGCCVAVLWTFIQTLPVPCRWVSSSQLLRAHLLEQAVTLGVLESPSCSLSWAPGSTCAALALTTTVTAVFLASIAISRIGHRKLLMFGVAASSTVMALVAIAHTVLRAERVFEWYTPQYAKPPLLLAPLLNPNHLAGQLALGFPLCLDFALRSRRLDLRIVWLGVSFIVLTAGLLSLSRGGAVALVAGGVGYLLVHVNEGRARQKRPSPWRLRVAVASVAAIFTFAAYFAADLLAAEFEAGAARTSKTQVMAQMSALIVQHPLVGVGRGALMDASPGVVPSDVRAAYAENLPLHWALEWGVPVAGTVLLLLLASLTRVRPRHPKDWALLSGFVALCAQNLVDFSLELAGVGTLAAIAFGILLSHERPQTALPCLPRPRLRPLQFVSCVSAALAVITAAPFLTSKSRTSLRARIEAAADDGSTSVAPLLRTALQNYPLDPAFASLAATHAVRTNDHSAPVWLNLAMALAPGWAAPHTLAAYYLERRGALSQAALEIRMSVERDVSQAGSLAGGFLARHPEIRLASAILPENSGHRQLVGETLIDALLNAAPAEVIEPFLRCILEEFPNSARAHSRYVETALRQNNSALAQQRARTMFDKSPSDPLSTATLIGALARGGSPYEALEVFDRAPPGIRADREVLLATLSAAGAAGDGARLNALTEELLAQHGQTAAIRAELHAHASTRYEVAGSLPQALSHAQQSFELSGELRMLERVHDLAERAGVVQVALRAAIELCHVGHRKEAYCTRPAAH